MTPSAAVLFRARWSILMHVLWTAILVVPLPVLILLAVLRRPSSGDGGSDNAARLLVDLAIGVGLWLPLGLLLAAVLWFNSRAMLTISTAGIETRGALGTRSFPWQDLRVVEVSDDWYYRGATCLVTTGGERVLLRFTAARYVAFRNEPWAETTSTLHDHRRIQLPARMAISAHQRYLRGEFR